MSSRARSAELAPQATTRSDSDEAECVARSDAHQEPRLVIRGETQPDASSSHAKLAHVDWLSFTVTPPPSIQPLPWIARMLEVLFFVPHHEWKSTGRGWQGYTHKVDLGDSGLLAYGGERQRGTIHVSLNAKACGLVKDWNAVRLWGETYAAHICRVDLAHDDFTAETVSIEHGLRWKSEGGFNLNGRPAVGHLRDDLGSDEGKTLYVGKRQNGKLCRIYEKGKQLGDKKSPWCRVELELRNKSRLVPWDTLTRPGAYLAGAYPCFSFLSLEQSKIKTVQRTFEMSYDRMREWVRTSAGRALNVMCEVERGDASAVMAQVMRKGQPKRLQGIPPPGQVSG